MVFKESGGVRLFPVLEKVFVVFVERRISIIPQKRTGHSIATLAVEIAEAKVGLLPKEGKQEVVPIEGRRWKQGAGKSKSGGVGGGYIFTFNLEGIRKLFTFVRNKIR